MARAKRVNPGGVAYHVMNRRTAAEKGTPEINVALETRHHLPMGYFSVAVAVSG